ALPPPTEQEEHHGRRDQGGWMPLRPARLPVRDALLGGCLRARRCRRGEVQRLSSGLRSGKRTTSRMLGESVKIIAKRSMPTPSPPRRGGRRPRPGRTPARGGGGGR